jgi:uncharacterized membrane protein
VLAFLVVLAFLPVRSRAVTVPSFTSIILGGTSFTSASDVSADGRVVVGDADGGRAFVWEAGAKTPLSFPFSDLATHALGVSDDGSTIVGGAFFDVETPVPVRWTTDPNAPQILAAPFTAGFAHAASADGSIVAGGGFIWTEGQGLVFISGEARAMSDDGSVVVGMASGDEPFRWTAETGLVRFGFPGEATAVSADGEVIVGSSFQGGAFRWTADGGLEIIGGGLPKDVSADGSIIVGEGSNRAIIWDGDLGVRFLQDVIQDDYGIDLSGWVLLTATGISADGNVIVGTGRDPNGTTRGWIFAVPEPGTALLLVGGLIGLARRHRH